MTKPITSKKRHSSNSCILLVCKQRGRAVPRAHASTVAYSKKRYRLQKNKCKKKALKKRFRRTNWKCSCCVKKESSARRSKRGYSICLQSKQRANRRKRMPSRHLKQRANEAVTQSERYEESQSTSSGAAITITNSTQGAPGAVGPQGPAGPQGPTGPSGLQGNSATPGGAALFYSLNYQDPPLDYQNQPLIEIENSGIVALINNLTEIVIAETGFYEITGTWLGNSLVDSWLTHNGNPIPNIAYNFTNTTFDGMIAPIHSYINLQAGDTIALYAGSGQIGVQEQLSLKPTAPISLYITRHA